MAMPSIGREPDAPLSASHSVGQLGRFVDNWAGLLRETGILGVC
jgi:hypothetical protein